MTSEFGHPPSDRLPALAHTGDPWYAESDGPPQRVPDLPSRRTTVLITAFFGLFGLIPASRHSRRAEQLGVSGSRYYTAFGVTFAVTTLAWAGVAAALSVAPSSDLDEPWPLVEADGGSGREDKSKGSVQRVAGEWTVEDLMPALDAFADDEFSGDGEDYGFDQLLGALVPCGSEEQGLAPDFIDTTLGGYTTVASVQLLPDPEAAERELARQTDILEGCTAGYELVGVDGATLKCEASIQTLTPVVRYREYCDGIRPDFYAIFRADNAVVSVISPSEAILDRRLSVLMSELDAD